MSAIFGIIHESCYWKVNRIFLFTSYTSRSPLSQKIPTAGIPTCLPNNHSATEAISIPHSGCREDQYTCPDDGYCIEKTRICDGEEDCRNGADEQNCRKFIFPHLQICRNIKMWFWLVVNHISPIFGTQDEPVPNFRSFTIFTNILRVLVYLQLLTGGVGKREPFFIFPLSNTKRLQWFWSIYNQLGNASFLNSLSFYFH